MFGCVSWGKERKKNARSADCHHIGPVFSQSRKLCQSLRVSPKGCAELSSVRLDRLTVLPPLNQGATDGGHRKRAHMTVGPVILAFCSALFATFL